MVIFLIQAGVIYYFRLNIVDRLTADDEIKHIVEFIVIFSAISSGLLGIIMGYLGMMDNLCKYLIKGEGGVTSTKSDHES